MFRNKKSKKVMFSESVMVAIERFRQAVEVMTESPVSLISADVEPGEIIEPNIPRYLKHKTYFNEHEGAQRTLEVCLVLALPVYPGFGHYFIELKGEILLVRWPCDRWHVSYKHMFSFSLTEQSVSGDNRAWSWVRQYDVCWVLNKDRRLFPCAMVYEYTSGEGKRRRFMSDIDGENPGANASHLSWTRVGQTYHDGQDEEGWFKGLNLKDFKRGGSK